MQQGEKCRSMFTEWTHCLISYRYIITAILATLASLNIHWTYPSSSDFLLLCVEAPATEVPAWLVLLSSAISLNPESPFFSSSALTVYSPTIYSRLNCELPTHFINYVVSQFTGCIFILEYLLLLVHKCFLILSGTEAANISFDVTLLQV